MLVRGCWLNAHSNVRSCALLPQCISSTELLFRDGRHARQTQPVFISAPPAPLPPCDVLLRFLLVPPPLLAERHVVSNRVVSHRSQFIKTEADFSSWCLKFSNEAGPRLALQIQQEETENSTSDLMNAASSPVQGSKLQRFQRPASSSASGDLSSF